MVLVLEKIIPGMPILMSIFTTGEHLPYFYDNQMILPIRTGWLSTSLYVLICQNDLSFIFDAATRSKTNETSFYILQTEKVTRNRKL